MRQYKKEKIGFNFIERTLLRKSGVSSRKPQCCGKLTRYCSQLAVKAAVVKISGSTHKPVTIAMTRIAP